MTMVSSDAKPGESFYLNGSEWRDLTVVNPTANFCIKGLVGHLNVNSTSAGKLKKGTVNLSGTASDIITNIEIKMDNGAWEGVNGTAFWYYELNTSRYADGPHTIQWKAMRGSYEYTYKMDLTIDNTPPVATITTPGLDSFHNIKNIAVNWTGTDETSGVNNYSCRLDDGEWLDTGSRTDHTFEDMDEGTHTVWVLLSDMVGNLNSTNITFHVDLTAPIVNISYPARNSFLNSTDLNVSWLGFDNLSGIQGYELFLDDGPTGFDVGTKLSHVLTNLTPGDHSIELRAWDLAGNSAYDSLNFTVDILIPEINETIMDKPTTGDIYTLRLAAMDESTVKNVIAEYDFGTGTGKNVTLVRGRGTWRANISVPANATELRYTFHVSDIAGNWNSTVPRTMEVIDDDPPVFGEISQSGQATTGDLLTLSVLTFDNLGIEQVLMKIEYGNESQNLSVSNRSGDRWGVRFAAPDHEGFSYRFAACDPSGNWGETATWYMEVVDDDFPEFISEPISNIPCTGNPFNITIRATDNIGIEGMNVSYAIDGGSSVAVMSRGGGDIWYHVVPIPADALYLEYFFLFWDAAGNTIRYPDDGSIARPVTDDDAPVSNAGENQAVENGTLVNFSGSGSSDIIGIINYTWSFEYNGTLQELYGPVTEFRFDKVGNYTIYLTVFDEAGNNDSDSLILSVKEVDMPDIGDDDDITPGDDDTVPGDDNDTGPMDDENEAGGVWAALSSPVGIAIMAILFAIIVIFFVVVFKRRGKDEDDIEDERTFPISKEHEAVAVGELTKEEPTVVVEENIECWDRYTEDFLEQWPIDAPGYTCPECGDSVAVGGVKCDYCRAGGAVWLDSDDDADDGEMENGEEFDFEIGGSDLGEGYSDRSEADVDGRAGAETKKEKGDEEEKTVEIDDDNISDVDLLDED